MDGRPTHPDNAEDDSPPTKPWSTEDATVQLRLWAAAIRQGRAVAVCDGSWKDDFGAAAFRLGYARGGQWHKVGEGTNWIKPGLTSTGSHRAELAGIHGIVAITAQCAQGDGPALTGRLTIGCDNQAALRSLDREWTFHSDDGDYDLLVAIQTLVKSTDIDIRGHHVKGHQDNTGRVLTKWEQWNVAMDTSAKAAWRTYILQGKREAPARPVHGPVWEVLLGNRQVQTASVERV